MSPADSKMVVAYLLVSLQPIFSGIVQAHTCVNEGHFSRRL